MPGMRGPANQRGKNFERAQRKKNHRKNAPHPRRVQSYRDLAADKSADNDARNDQQSGANIHGTRAIVGQEGEQTGGRHHCDQARSLGTMLTEVMKQHQQWHEQDSSANSEKAAGNSHDARGEKDSNQSRARFRHCLSLRRRAQSLAVCSSAKADRRRASGIAQTAHAARSTANQLRSIRRNIRRSEFPARTSLPREDSPRLFSSKPSPRRVQSAAAK